MNSPMIRTRTDGHTDTDRWTHRHGQMDTKTRTDGHKDTDRWTHKSAEGQADGWTQCAQTDKYVKFIPSYTAQLYTTPPSGKEQNT
jgi:hypothetical protein